MSKKRTQKQYSPTIKLSAGRRGLVKTEKDPDGTTHTHVIVQDRLQRMYRSGAITKEMLDASRKFHQLFTIAHLNTMSSMPLLPSSGYKEPSGLTEKQNDARKRITQSLNLLGGRTSAAGSCIWHVVGLEHSIREWCAQQSLSNTTHKPYNQHHARGILVAALDILARHYGYATKRG